MFPKYKIAAISLAAVLAGPAALAQSVTQGAIVGTVEDNTGAVVSHATVEIRNNGTNSVLKLTSDDKGFFNAPLLQPGEYTVTVNAGTFAPYIQSRVTVQVGQPTELHPRLGATTDTTVTVTESTPALNFESPQFTDVIDNKAIVNIPENNRRWSSLALTTPGVVSDSNGYGLVSIRGISPLLNNVLIDGADDNQAFFSEERGRTREAYSTSEDAVQEFTVNTGVYPAEFGRSGGGVINSVTKSGTNQIHGEAYFYDRESGFAAFTPLSTNAVLNPATNTYSNVPIKPKDLRKIYGFSAGGALLRDKLFWFYTFDEHNRHFPGIGRPSNPTTFLTLPETSLAAGETCDLTTGFLYTGALTALTPSGTTQSQQACTLAARARLGSYAAGAAAYDAQIASVNTDLGLVPRIGDQEINTPKLDFQINSKNRLSLLYHRLRWDSPGGVQTAATAFYSTDAFGNDFVKLDYGLAKLESQITSRISNELGYQYSRELDYETQQPYSAYTTNNLVGNGGNVPYVNLATSSGFNLGSPYYSYRTAYPDERKWQVFDTAYWVKGNHTFKAGVDLLHNYDLINNTYESNGDYSYTYIGNYFADLLAKKSGAANAGCASGASQTATVVTNATTGVKTLSSAVGALPCYTDYYQGYGNPLVATSTTDYGFFVQDNWKVNPRLTVELGVRYDYQAIPQPFANLTVASGTYVPFAGVTNHPSDKNNIGPRAGFALDVFGNGKTVLRGGYGIFFGRILNGTIENTYLNTGSPLGQYTTTYLNSTANAPTFANLTSNGALAAPAVYYFDQHMQNPQVHEYDLILQQDLGRSLTVSLSYLGSGGRQLPNFLNLNLNPTTSVETITFTGAGPIPNGTKVQVPVYTAYGNTALFGTGATAFQAITEVTSDISSSYNAFVAEAKSKNFHGLQMDANYTWSHALDYGQNAQTQGVGNNYFDPYNNVQANYGNSNYNVPNRFASYFLYDFPNIHDGARWAKLIANQWSINDSFQMQNGLPYSLGISGTLTGARLSGINGAGGVSFIPNTFVPGYTGLGRNTYKLPRDIVDDVRVVKGFPITNRYALELRADVFNIANHQNVSSVGTTGYTISTTTTALTSTAAYQATTFGVPATVNSSGFLYTPRNIQISARFTF